MNAEYSGTPLWKKLGWKEGMRIALIGAPDNYQDLLGIDQPATSVGPLCDGTQALHLFTKSREELVETLQTALPLIDRNGMIWVSWPKKAAKIPTDVTEDVIREVCLPMGLVDIKVCAVDPIWSGLKLVIRKELR